MEEKNEWVFFEEIDWDCPNNNQFNVDTRDFHVGYKWSEPHKDFNTLKKYPHFFLSLTELKDLLKHYYDESGGSKDWRYFSLVDYDNGWSLKYLRIYRTEIGFVVCNSDKVAIKKSILYSKINQEMLHSH